MSRRILCGSLGTLVVFFAGLNQDRAWSQTLTASQCQQLEASLPQYEQQVQQWCQAAQNNPQYAQYCNYYKQDVAYLQSVAKQCQQMYGGGGAGDVPDQCEQQRQQVQQIAQQALDKWYSAVNSYEQYYGRYLQYYHPNYYFVIWYCMPPTYCSQTQYSCYYRTSAYPYEVYRELQSLANNRDYIALVQVAW